MRSALAFQLVIVPAIVRLRMASAENPTTALSLDWSSADEEEMALSMVFYATIFRRFGRDSLWCFPETLNPFGGYRTSHPLELTRLVIRLYFKRLTTIRQASCA